MRQQRAYGAFRWPPAPLQAEEPGGHKGRTLQFLHLCAEVALGERGEKRTHGGREQQLPCL